MQLNYKVELESDNKSDEITKVEELEKYLRNNKKGLLRYQYRLGYKAEEFEKIQEQLPSLGSEESHMYCVCRERMKKNRTSWCEEGADAMLQVIMHIKNGTLQEVITHRAEEKIKEELAQRIPDPIKVKKVKQGQIVYAGKYEIANNFTGSERQYVIDLLRSKSCTELNIIN